ncbi:hypothetical protein ACIF9R_34935 [Streptomyces sp. NPDC086080]
MTSRQSWEESGSAAGGAVEGAGSGPVLSPCEDTALAEGDA